MNASEREQHFVVGGGLFQLSSFAAQVSFTSFFVVRCSTCTLHIDTEDEEYHAPSQPWLIAS